MLVATIITRYSMDMRRALFILFVMVTSGAFSNPWDPMPSIQVEAVPLAGLASLSVRSDIRRASVWLDYQMRGTVPLDLTGIKPGTHILVIKADGYYDASITLSLAADTKTTLSTSLILKTGFLDVRVQPATASVIIDEQSYAPGIIELGTGQKTVTLKAFGYTEQTFSVFVPERLYASISAELSKATFEARGFELSQRRFNPRNPGINGLIRASFTVSATGSALIEIMGPDGETIVKDTMGTFNDWSQSYTWDGRDEFGKPLSDGDYTIALTVTPGAGIESERESYSFSASMLLDQSLIVVPTGSYGVMYGSVFAPMGFRPQSYGFRVDALGYATGSLDASGSTSGGATVSVAGSIQDILDAGIGMELDGQARVAARLGIRYAAPLSEPFGLGAILEGRISEPTVGNQAFVRLGAVMGIGSPFFNAVVMPRIGAYWEEGSLFKAGLGMALTANAYSFGASLSAAVDTESLSTGLSMAWPLRSALELRFSPARVPLSFRLMGELDWSPRPTAWTAGLGISGGF